LRADRHHWIELSHECKPFNTVAARHRTHAARDQLSRGVTWIVIALTRIVNALTLIAHETMMDTTCGRSHRRGITFPPSLR
jgi:hypothetical protein